MKMKWTRKTDEEGLKNLVNVMLPIYCMYLRDRGPNLTSVEYERNLVPILKSGIIEDETLDFIKYEVEAIEHDLKIESKNSILEKIKK